MLNKFTKIRLFVFDIDGVLTDGNLLILPDGQWARTMNIKDGYALQLAVKKGYRILVISGGDAVPVKQRLQKLGITDIFLPVQNKPEILQQYLQDYQIPREAVLYMGDDIPDLAAMQLAGLPCCPLDAATEIKQSSLYISPLAGGKGCVRDVIEKVLKLNGHWEYEQGLASR